MNLWKQTFFVGLAAFAMEPASAAVAQAGTGAEPLGEPLTQVEVVDLSPRFLAFYEAAQEENAGEQRRWELWKELYDFAALPPVPERDSLAREMLKEAWPRYPAVLERIEHGGQALKPAADSLLDAVAGRLRLDEPVKVRLLVFVGDTRSGAFFAAAEGAATIAAPIEESPEQLRHGLAHEFTHAVHHQLADLSAGWERSVARTVFAEGLAMRMEQALFPGRTAAEYVAETRAGWFEEAESAQEDILRGLLPHLRDRSSEQVARFTIGTGTTGLRREAYYAGWVLVGNLLDSGHSLAELARVPEDRIPTLVESGIADLFGIDR